MTLSSRFPTNHRDPTTKTVDDMIAPWKKQVPMSKQQEQRADQALGMRTPPVWIARIGIWFRRLLDRIATMMTPSPILVYERLLGLVDNAELSDRRLCSDHSTQGSFPVVSTTSNASA